MGDMTGGMDVIIQGLSHPIYMGWSLLDLVKLSIVLTVVVAVYKYYFDKAGA